MQQVEWAEFELQEFFTSFNGDFDIQKTHINGFGNYVITAGLSNDGILGKSDVKAKIFNEKTITVDMFGNAFYRAFDYKMVTHARVFSLKPNFSITHNQGLFLSSLLYFLKEKFDYNNMCSWIKIKNEKISLPVKPNKDLDKLAQIDFDFMERFIAELETTRLVQLDNHLTKAGLKDCTLTDDEWGVLSEFQSNQIKWAEYKMCDLFDKVKTKKLPYQAKELPTEPAGDYDLPCLTSSFKNQGLNYYTPKDEATVLKNVISIPSNSDVYRAYYQPRDFTVLSDAYAIDWKYDDKIYDGKLFLFMVTSINQVTDLPIYSYKNKLGGWNVVKDKYIQLPTKEDKPDIAKMQLLISALQKLAIKDVVHYADKKVEATKQ